MVCQDRWSVMDKADISEHLWYAREKWTTCISVGPTVGC